MNRSHAPCESGRDRGAMLALFAILLTALMVMSAFAVDLGMLYNERRQDQSAADSGVLGGALDFADGVVPASESAARIVRANLPQGYTDDEWKAAWASCTDPDHLTYKGEVLGVITECISSDGSSTLRVRVPDQQVDTALLNVIGFSEFTSNAIAEASFEQSGVAGVLPFAVLGNAADGAELCLRAASGGQSLAPCFGSQSGNFGGLEIGQYGNLSMGTEVLPCNLNKSDQLMVNISVGVDHDLSVFDGTQVADVCDTAVRPNYVNTFQGISNGTFEGLITGGTVAGRYFEGRLTQGTTPSRELRKSGSYFIDNVPLWDYIGYGKAGSVPVGCERESFDAAPDHATAASQLTTCLTDHAAGSGYDPLFDYDADANGEPDLVSSVRFSIVPQFVESTFPSGNGNLHIREFRRVYLNDLYFGCNGSGNCSAIVRPGESTSSVNLPNGNQGGFDQVTGYLLPNDSLPLELQVTENSKPVVRLTH